MPAVVVGHHGHGGVADLGFTSELGFLKVGHADQVRAPTAIQVRFCAGGKLRPFHANVGPAEFAGHAHLFA